MIGNNTCFRSSLRDGLKVANAQDLNGVTGLTLLMLGYTYTKKDSGNEVSIVGF